MMESQMPLFGDTAPGPATRDGLIVIAPPGRPLSKAQRVFNRLVVKIETLHAALRERTRELDETLIFFGVHVAPRRARLATLETEFLLALAEFLDARALSKGDRRILKTTIGKSLDDVIEADGGLADARLRAVFERVHGVRIEEVERWGREDALGEIETLFEALGVDVDLSGFHPGMNEEAFASECAKLVERLQQEGDDGRGAEARFSEHKERPKTKRQLQKEERARQTAAARKKTIGTIYRQLARALHPDLEPDPELRGRKHALMQGLTVAYRNNDLHTLLRLELEWIEREKVDLERLSDEKLRIYTDVLKEQAADLEEQVHAILLDARYQAITISDGFSIGSLDGPQEVKRLDGLIEGLETTLARLRGRDALLEVRALIRAQRAAN